MYNVDNLATFMCLWSGNYGSIYLLEPEGPVQDSMRIVLPLLHLMLCPISSNNILLVCDKSARTQNLGFLSYWYRNKRLQMHFFQA